MYVQHLVLMSDHSFTCSLACMPSKLVCLFWFSRRKKIKNFVCDIVMRHRSKMHECFVYSCMCCVCIDNVSTLKTFVLCALNFGIIAYFCVIAKRPHNTQWIGMCVCLILKYLEEKTTWLLYQQLLLLLTTMNISTKNKTKPESLSNETKKCHQFFFLRLYESVCFLKYLEEDGKYCIAFPAIRIQVNANKWEWMRINKWNMKPRRRKKYTSTT